MLNNDLKSLHSEAAAGGGHMGCAVCVSLEASSGQVTVNFSLGSCIRDNKQTLRGQ